MEPFVVLTGMHRSNTSMFAQILSASGIRLGASLVGPDAFNPYGHFEDQEIVDLHEEILEKHGCNWRVRRKRTFDVSPEDDQQFRKIIQQRQREADGVWGFKVPHATLLLPYWEQYIEAKFVLIFRNPAAVLRSLYRRVGKQIYYKPYYVLNCLHIYRIYNELVYECYQRNSSRSYLVCSDDLVESPGRVVEALGHKLDIPVTRPSDALIDRKVIGRSGGWYVERLVQWFATKPALQQCYQQLDEVCDTRHLRDARRAKAA